MIEQAFHAYTKAVETAFEASRRPPTRRGVLVGLPNKVRHLCDLVDQLEEGREFRALLEGTHSVFASDGYHSKSKSSWRDSIRHFFRRTGYYTNTFAGSDTPCDLVKRYEKAFRRRHVQTTYLAPLEFVQFPKRELEFSGFKIRKFDRNELDEIVGNDVNRVFYPDAVVDTDALQEYWFIVVKVEEEVRRLGYLYYSAADAAAAEGRVFLKYTGFPPEIERVLTRLVLFDWVGDPQNRSTYRGRNGDPFGFNIPFVIRVVDNDLGRPQTAPDRSKLESYVPKYGDPDTGEVYNAHDFIFEMNESRGVAFEQCIQRADECLRHLEKKKHDTKLPYLDTLDTRWPFLKVAVGNLIKAFFAAGLEQLLWHITALEALLGERGSGITASLARRSTAILSTTEKERKECRKKFRELYDLRSALVHGRQFKEDVHRKQLFEARMMVLRVTIWFVHYLGEIAARIKEESWQAKVPKREDFLSLLDLSNADCILLDLSNADRNGLSALLGDLPTGFPEDILSLSDLSDADRDRLKALLGDLPTGFPSAPDWSP